MAVSGLKVAAEVLNENSAALGMVRHKGGMSRGCGPRKRGPQSKAARSYPG